MRYDDLVQPGSYICHHGVKGQHWGEKNGPPYPLAYSQKSSDEKNAVKTVKVNKKELSINEKIKKIKDADLLTEDDYYEQRKNQGAKGSKDFRWEGRLKRAADTGLKALNKCGRDGFDEKIGITNDDRWWFICEDQTIGLGTVADLVNRGYSKAKILNLINIGYDVNGNKDLDWNDIPKGGFQLAEIKVQESDNFIEKFIDECERNRS